MKILITGCAGFVGSNLANELLNRGHKITGVDNFSYGLERNIINLRSNKNFQFFELNVESDLNQITDKFDLIVHLASQKIPRYSNSYKTICDNSDMLNSVLVKCLADDSRLLFSSTSDVYGKNPVMPFSEDSNLVLGPTTVKRWAYAASKIHSEHKIIAFGEEKALKYTIVRFFGSFGKNQNLTWWGGPQSVFIDKAIKNEFIELHGDGNQTRTLTYIEDTVQGLVKCIENDKAVGEIYNIASNPDEEISIKNLAIKIWKLVRPGEEPKLKTIPYETFGKYEDVQII